MAPDHGFEISYSRITVGDMGTNAYLVHPTGKKACVIVDPGAEADTISAQVAAKHLEPVAIVLTHAHIDHCGAADALKHRYRIPLWIHKDDERLLTSEQNRQMAAFFRLPPPPDPDRLLDGGMVIFEDFMPLDVMHTPGHTPGSICLAGAGLLFTGDTLFNGSVGRTDLPGGSFPQLQRSLEAILEFPPETCLLPGHGDLTNLKQEMALNPFL